MSKRIKPNKISLQTANTSAKDMMQAQTPAETLDVLGTTKSQQDKLERYDELDRQVKSLSDEKDGLERRLEEYIVSNRRLESEADELRARLSEYQTRNAAMAQEIESLKKELSETKFDRALYEAKIQNLSAQGGSSIEPSKFSEFQRNHPVEIERKNIYSEPEALPPRYPYAFGGPRTTRDGYDAWN